MGLTTEITDTVINGLLDHPILKSYNIEKTIEVSAQVMKSLQIKARQNNGLIYVSCVEGTKWNKQALRYYTWRPGIRIVTFALNRYSEKDIEGLDDLMKYELDRMLQLNWEPDSFYIEDQARENLYMGIWAFSKSQRYPK